jgi:low temperature requirement protein LtrA
VADTKDRGQRSLLRGRAEGEQQVRPIELFFDLVFVFAVTQLSQRLLGHLTIGGAAQTLLLLLVVWQAWVTTAWVTNWFNPDQLPVRLMLVGVMLASLFMSVAIPDAFGERALTFAAAIVPIHVGRAAFAFIALRTSLGGSDPLARTFQRTLSWHTAAGMIWIAGGLLDGRARYLLWGLALAVNFGAPLIGYYLPGLGSSHTGEWNLQGLHFAERCRLFVIIALGESLLVTGTTLAEGDVVPATTAAFVVAFLTSVTLWWIYFHHSAEAASRTLASTADPGRLAARPTATSTCPWSPGSSPWPHLVAIGVLAALGPVGFAAPALMLGAATRPGPGRPRRARRGHLAHPQRPRTAGP